MRVRHLLQIDCALMVSLLTLAPFSLSGQQFPDGSALLKRSADAFKSYNTYQFTQVTSTGMSGMDMTMVQQATSSGKMRMEMKMGSMGGMLMISDGKDMWMYMGMFKSYMKVPSDPGAMGGLAGAFGGGQMGDMSQLNLDAKVVRSETIEIDGEPHDCWVVETRMGDFAPPIVRSVKFKGGVSVHWIDKKSDIEFKTVMTSKTQVTGASEPLETTATMTKHSLKLNEPIPDSVFVFTPPADAKETDELFPGMKAMLGSTETASPAKAATVTAPIASPSLTALRATNPSAQKPAPGPGEPRAFVRSLMAIEETEPIYPEAARAKDVHGMVELLVTIDPAGRVVKAEALSGAEVLRPAAIDAVRQWKFRPVIRNGNPVYAYTSSTVDFLDQAKPFSLADSRRDMNDEMAAMNRFEALEEEFPRSPQEELANLEQDRASNEANRSYVLPQLAKAALKAGDFGKATKYATEALRLPSSNFTYAQAIHEGNMVLGVIALREGNVAQAKHYLQESGKSTGSPMSGPLGPNMALAKGLLEAGERDAVIEYFQSCRAFWKDGAEQLDEWTATVRKGGMPAFGANLMY